MLLGCDIFFSYISVSLNNELSLRNLFCLQPQSVPMSPRLALKAPTKCQLLVSRCQSLYQTVHREIRAHEVVGRLGQEQ